MQIFYGYTPKVIGLLKDVWLQLDLLDLQEGVSWAYVDFILFLTSSEI